MNNVGSLIVANIPQLLTILIGATVCRGEGKWEFSVPSAQFFCKSKTVKKKKEEEEA